MRDYKFRGKKIDGSGFVYGYYYSAWTLDTDENGVMRIKQIHFIVDTDEMICRKPYEVFPFTVGQFTCLTDDDLNEIYEGDIMKEYETKYVIGFYNGRFEGVIDSHISVDIDYVATHAKIIGNIHETDK